MTTQMPDTSPATSPNRGLSYLYMAAAFVIVVAGMRAAEAILNPLLLAIFLSIISAPAYFKLLKRGVSDWLALLTVVGVLSAVVILLVFIVMGSIQGFMENADHYEQRLREEQRRAELTVERLMPQGWLRDEKSSNVDANEVTDDADSATDKTRNSQPDSASTEISESIESGSTDSRNSTDQARATADSVEADTGDVNVTGEQATADDRPEEISPPPSASEPSIVAANRPVPVPPGMGASLRLVVPRTTLPATEQNYEDYIKEQFSFSTAISLARGVVFSIGQLLSNAFLILLIVIFILLEAGTFGRKLKDAMERTEETRQRADQIINSVQHYIAIKTWMSLGTGLLVTLWLWFWGVSHSPLWGLLAFLFNYIPNVGSILAAIPAVLVAWLDVGAFPAAMTSIGYLVINGAIGNFLEPRLMGKSLGLSPLVIFFSMLFWGWVLGPVGMLLSVPLTMAARIAMDGFDDTRWLATLMGNVE